MASPTDYWYPHFHRRLLLDYISFGDAPTPGDEMPDFDLPTTEGERVRKNDFVGQTPFLLSTGSMTCPMTATSGPVLRDLHEEFGSRIPFITLYVVEVHPGDQIPQPATSDEKFRTAVRYKERDLIPWSVAVDDVEGTFHRRLASLPNATWIVDYAGRIVFRSLWSNYERDLRPALEAAAAGLPVPVPERRSMIIPLLRGTGVMDSVLRQAGPVARRDMRRAAPPMYALGRLASTFKPLSPLGRGVAAVTAAGAATALLASGARRLARARTARS